jgi:hypothetical protein
MDSALAQPFTFVTCLPLIRVVKRERRHKSGLMQFLTRVACGAGRRTAAVGEGEVGHRRRPARILRAAAVGGSGAVAQDGLRTHGPSGRDSCDGGGAVTRSRGRRAGGAHGGVGARRSDEHKQKPEHHCPQRGAIGSEAGALVHRPARAVARLAGRPGQVTLGSAAADGHGSALGEGGQRRRRGDRALRRLRGRRSGGGRLRGARRGWRIDSGARAKRADGCAGGALTSPTRGRRLLPWFAQPDLLRWQRNGCSTHRPFPLSRAYGVS